MGSRGPKRKTDPKIAVAYLRISKDEPGSHSVEAQRADIERWAVANRVRVVAWHADNGLSGAVPVDGRPALAAALGDVYERRAGLLVAVAHDRIARDVGVALAVEQELGSIGARSATVTGLNLTALTPDVRAALAERIEDDRLAAQVAAQMERRRISRRTKRALALKRSKGQQTGPTPPFGFRHVDGKLVEDPREQAAIKAILRLRADGHTLKNIASLLPLQGHQPRGTTWHVPMLSKLIKRHARAA